MKSLPQVRKDIEQIKAVANPVKKCIVWYDIDGFYYIDGRKYKTKRGFEKYAEKQGYTMTYVVAWIEQASWLSPEERAAEIAKTKWGTKA